MSEARGNIEQPWILLVIQNNKEFRGGRATKRRHYRESLNDACSERTESRIRDR